MPTPAQVAAEVRLLSGVPAGTGPTDEIIAASVLEVAEKFNYWYGRVMKEASGKYRSVIIGRINPFIRRLQFGTLDCKDFAARVVEDYDRRNFVTAGGWLLEALAISLNPEGRKSAAQGIDLQLFNAITSEHSLYVIKSGNVTRNTDIVSALKTNLRGAEKILRQSKAPGRITLNWAVAAGKNTTTFEDGIRRPSSAEFWSEVTGLTQDQAINLATAIVGEAGKLVGSDVSVHLRALETLVSAYLEDPNDKGKVDWKFLNRRGFFDKGEWKAIDQARHKRALTALKATGYGEFQQVAEASQNDDGSATTAMEGEEIDR